MAGSVTFTSCEKAEDEINNVTPTPNPNPNPNPTPSPEPVFPTGNNVAGVMVGVKTITYQNSPIFPLPIEVEFGTATAFFPTNVGDFTSFQNVGDVTCNSKKLTIQTNNSYVFTPGLLDQEGINFDNGSNWEISGGGTINPMTMGYIEFPDAGKVNSGDVDVSQDYILSIESAVGAPADSLYFGLYGADDYILKTVGPNVTSVTFTAAELANIGATDFGIAQVTAYTMRTVEANNTDFYMVNETVNSKTVKIQ